MSDPTSELSAAWLQAAITVGLGVLCLYIYRKFRKPHFGAWALAWGLYSLRLGAIIRFMQTDGEIWLYWHQVATGVTALALLWAALVFSRQLIWRWRYIAIVAFPVVWSYLAIFRMENFLLAAGPAVAFLSAATMLTGVALLVHQRRVQSVPARFLGWSFVFWSLHHLDYPFLRAQGAWNPWGYYLDIGFELAIGAGILLLVLEEQDRGLRVLSGLAEDLQAEGSEEDVVRGLLRRPLTLSGVHGSALYVRDVDTGGRFIGGAGQCETWTGEAPSGPLADRIATVLDTGRPAVLGRPGGEAESGLASRFLVVLPVFEREDVIGAIVVTGDARDPFTALDEDFLIALGQQVGAALARRDLLERLELRDRELRELTARMIDQHESERRRLQRELHDETAQVLAAVRLQIGRALETADGPETKLMERAVEMVSSGIKGVRRVIDDLRPALLDDLGLRPALAALAFEFERASNVPTTFRAPQRLPKLASAVELALFRALQEALANVGRHADARHVEVELDLTADEIRLSTLDDGRGPGDAANGNQGAGLVGMRERVEGLGGTVTLASIAGGSRLEVRIPRDESRPS